MLARLSHQIVDADSLAVEHEKERKLPISENHIDMCKFGREGDSFRRYQQIVKPQVTLHLERSLADANRDRM